MVNSYLVEWKVDIEAYSAVDAARQALEMQRRPDSTATVFDVVVKQDGHVPLRQRAWTLVSDSLPELEEHVYLATRNAEVLRGKLTWRQGWDPDRWEIEGEGDCSAKDGYIVAWMLEHRPTYPAPDDSSTISVDLSEIDEAATSTPTEAL